MSHFEKVSFEQFEKDCKSVGFFTGVIPEVYEEINLPQRATKNSAGSDIYSPFTFTIGSKIWTKIPLGIRWVCNKNDHQNVLLIIPRSGLGCKHGVRIRNTVGVIDSDYFCSDNEGHIWATLSADDDVQIERGKAILQGIIVPFCTTDDDCADGIRNGGFGSTDERK